MLGSPNWIRGVTDPAAYPDTTYAPGSQTITELFRAHFRASGATTWPMTWNGDSDDYPFALAGILTGGLTIGAGGNPARLKTAEQAALFGGAVDEYHDACSHLPCGERGGAGLPATLPFTPNPRAPPRRQGSRTTLPRTRPSRRWPMASAASPSP